MTCPELSINTKCTIGISTLFPVESNDTVTVVGVELEINVMLVGERLDIDNVPGLVVKGICEFPQPPKPRKQIISANEPMRSTPFLFFICSPSNADFYHQSHDTRPFQKIKPPGARPGACPDRLRNFPLFLTMNNHLQFPSYPEKSPRSMALSACFNIFLYNKHVYREEALSRKSVDTVK
jgi:hypothetical protein